MNKLKKIRVIKPSTGAPFFLGASVGQVTETFADLAQKLIEAGHAEEVKESQRVPAYEKETATSKTQEAATTRKSRKPRKKKDS